MYFQCNRAAPGFSRKRSLWLSLTQSLSLFYKWFWFTLDFECCVHASLNELHVRVGGGAGRLKDDRHYKCLGETSVRIEMTSRGLCCVISV